MDAPDHQQQPAQAVDADVQPTSSQQPQAQQEAAAAAPEGSMAANIGGGAEAAAPGGSSEPSGPAGTAGAAEGPIYVSKREVRRTVGKVLGKKTAYYLEFYLVDNHGYETLAAIGEDQGAPPGRPPPCMRRHACMHACVARSGR